MALMPVSEARGRILADVVPLEAEDLGLRFALNRTLARDVEARLTQPPFAASAMDGYAVRAGDVATAPATLRCTGEAAAGKPYGGTVAPGHAVRIFTGAELPDGADAVVIQEDTRAAGDQITCTERAIAGAHVRPRGQDFTVCDIVLKRGAKLSPRNILLAATAGHGTVTVTRRPVVAILATGNELVEPGEKPGPGQIVGSNSYGIAALVEAAGGAPHVVGIADDTVDDIVDALRSCGGADVLITIGGASVGDHDLVRPALAKAGATLDFYKIAMRPGKPLFFGTRLVAGKLQRCIGLPGNPVSAMIGTRVFVVPLIDRLLGRETIDDTFEVALAEPLAANGPREHYMRATLNMRTVPPTATPLRNQDSALVAAFAGADCILRIPAGAPRLEAGARVSALGIDY